MKVPLSWLQEMVAIPGDVDDLIAKLTFSGIEVEGVTKVGEGLDGVVVGRIEDWGPHPNADRLRLCRVHDGTGIRQVVCGASNFEVGDFAAFAAAGVVLPNGLKLKVAKVRGEVSEGMLCAEDELGLSDDHAGILLLPASAQPGEPLSKYYPAETVLALEITWNRPDCMSVYGVARELSALYGVPLKEPVGEPTGYEGQVAGLVNVRIEDEQACPRYTAHLLRGVKIGPSPAAVQRRLQLCGIRPINNIVDATNYVMLELGQPLHAFDFGLVRAGGIIVRKAIAGETITTLDEVERKLSTELLVIADRDRAVAVAGVMGGAGSEIGDCTQDVLIESAGFDPRTVRRGSVQLGLSSESSHRFERGVDETRSAEAGRRALYFMQAWGGGTPVGGVVDEYPRPYEPAVILLRAARVEKVLGISVSVGEIELILRSLGFTVRTAGEGQWEVTVPSYRRDVTCDADIIEEIARMHGIDAVPEKLPVARIVADADDAVSHGLYRCRELLAGAGFSEAMHYSFLPAALLDAWCVQDAELRLVLPNPVSADQGVMRNSLIPQLVESLARNRAHQVDSAALFETGTVYWHDQASGNAPEEALHVGIGIMGRLHVPGRQDRSAVTTEDVYFTLKGVVENLVLDLTGLACTFEVFEHVYCESGHACRITLAGRPIGFMGIVHKERCKSRRITLPVAVAELELAPLLVHGKRSAPVSAIPAYPTVSRDFAAFVDESFTHRDMMLILEKNAPDELTGVSLFDIFRGEEIEQGKKSMGYSLTYQSATRTLTDEEVNGLHERVKSALKREAGVQFRE